MGRVVDRDWGWGWGSGGGKWDVGCGKWDGKEIYRCTVRLLLYYTMKYTRVLPPPRSNRRYCRSFIFPGLVVYVER